MKKDNTGTSIPKGFTAQEWKEVQEYRKTGKLPRIPYEPLDFDKVGGVKPTKTKK